MTPVSPPERQVRKNAATNSTGVVKRTRRPQQVAIQQNSCAPVGMAIAIEEAVNKLLPTRGKPVANMWWTHSPKDRKPIDMIEITASGYPTMPRRAPVSMMVLAMPTAGKKMMYTSGCPKNQKRCCHRRASPPSAGLKKCVPTSRSAISMLEHTTIEGMAKIMQKEVTSIAQTNIGMRCSDMPGALNLKTVTMISTDTASAEISVNVMSCAQKSERLPAPYSGPAKGG